MNDNTKKAATAFFFADIAEQNLTRMAEKIDRELKSDDPDEVNAALSLLVSLCRARDVVRHGIEAAQEAVA